MDKKSLDASADSYGGVIVDPDSLPTSPDEFRDRLRQSIEVRKGFSVVNRSSALLTFSIVSRTL